MNLTEEIITVGKEKATRIKAFLEELELQMALGKADARDAIETERKKFQDFLKQYRSEIQETDFAGLDHLRVLHAKFAKLGMLVDKKFPTRKRDFDKFKKETLHAIYDLELTLKGMYGDIDPVIMARLDAFKDKLDAYRIQLAFLEFKQEDEIKDRKIELLEAINEIRDRLQERELVGDKFDHFADDISEAYDKMKKAFSDLFA